MKVVIDFETAGACDLKESGAARYSEDLTTEIISLGWKTAPGVSDIEESKSGLWIPEHLHDSPLFAYAADTEVMFVAHNAGFEKWIWANIMVAQHGWPEIAPDRWIDTQAMCAMRAIPLDLNQASRVLGLSQVKDNEGSLITKGLSRPNKQGYYVRDPGVLERVYRYNMQDVETTAEMHKCLGDLPPSERDVWLLDQTINARGVKLDMNLAAKMQEIVDKASPPLVKRFSDLTGGLLPSQAIRVREWVQAQGVPIKSLNKEIVGRLLGETDEDSLAEDSETDEDIVLPDVVRQALTVRALVNSASVKKLKKMRACVSLDGRARGLLQYHGAATGRFSGRLLQPQNFPRGTVTGGIEEKVQALLTGDPDYVEMALGPPVETVVSSLRHVIQAESGKVLVASDFSAIEARIVLALAGQRDKLAAVARGVSMYCDMGEKIYGRVISKKTDPTEYHISKGAVLGLGFNCGAKTFRMRVAPDKPLEFCKNVVDIYRRVWAPKVPPLWEGLGTAALATVMTGRPHEAYGVEYRREGPWLSARLPSGRKLWYFNPQKTMRAMPWDPDDIRPAWSYQQMKTGQWTTINAYGGLLTENVVQGLARDLMVGAMKRLELEGYSLVLTVHDELVMEVLEARANIETIESIICETPQWARSLSLPVAVETTIGTRYSK